MPHRTLTIATFNYPDRTNAGVSDNIHRDTDQFFVKGNRINLRFYHSNTNAVKIHYGFLQHKGFCDNDNRTNLSINAGYVQAEFFRNYLSTGDKWQSFENDGTNHSYTYDILPINSDKFRILTHKRIVIHGTQSTETIPVKHRNTYMKLNKRVGFENGLDKIGTSPIFFFCYWQFMDPSVAATGKTVSVDLSQTPFFS